MKFAHSRINTSWKERISLPTVLVSSLFIGCVEDPLPHQNPNVISLARARSVVSFRPTGFSQDIQIADNYFLVYFQPEATEQQKRNVVDTLASTGIRKVGENSLSNLIEFNIPALDQLNSLLSRVTSMPGVFAALPDPITSSSIEPDHSQNYSSQSGFYWIDLINARQAWDLTTGSRNIRIAILDSAVDNNSIFLSNKDITHYVKCARGDIHTGEIFFGLLGSSLDPSTTCNSINLSLDGYHGTQVSSLAAATGSNNLLGVGMAWTNPIVSIDINGYSFYDPIGFPSARVPRPNDSTTFWSHVDVGIQTALSAGSRVINISYGVVCQFDIPGRCIIAASQESRYLARLLIRNAVLTARRRDALIVFSAGNESALDVDLLPTTRFMGIDPINQIEYFSNLIYVGSVDSDRCASYFSNFGPPIQIYAPGNHLLVPSLSSDPIISSGTSLAAPIVAGTAALIMSIAPDMSAQRVKEIILQSSQTAQSSCFPRGSGPILNAFAAVQAAQQTTQDAGTRSDASVDSVVARPRYDFGYGSFDNIIRTSDGGFILSGSSIPDPSHPNVGGFLKVVKLDSSRNVVYVRSINLNDPMFSSHSLLTANQIVETNDGGLLVGVTAEFLKIFKLNRSGEVVWSFGGTPNMTRLDDNRYFFTNGGNTSSQYFRVFNHIDGAYSAFYWLDTAYPTADSLVPALRSRYGSSLFPSSGYLPTFWTNDFSTLYYYNYLSTTETPDAGPSVSSVYIGFARYDPHPLLPAESIQRLHNPSVVNVIELISTSAAINPRPESIPISDGFLFSLQTGTGSEQRRTMVKLGLNGEVAWRGTFNLSGAYITSTEDDRGNIIFLFRQTSGLVTLSKIDHSGNVVFSRELPSEIGGISSIIAAPDGYLLAGNLTGSAGLPSRPIVVHLDAAGNVSD